MRTCWMVTGCSQFHNSLLLWIEHTLTNISTFWGLGNATSVRVHHYISKSLFLLWIATCQDSVTHIVDHLHFVFKVDLNFVMLNNSTNESCWISSVSVCVYVFRMLGNLQHLLWNFRYYMPVRRSWSSICITAFLNYRPNFQQPFGHPTLTILWELYNHILETKFAIINDIIFHQNF